MLLGKIFSVVRQLMQDLEARVVELEGASGGEGGGLAGLRYIAGGTQALDEGAGTTTVAGPFTRLADEAVLLAIYPVWDGNVCWSNLSTGADEGCAFLENASGGGNDFNVVFRNVNGGAKSVTWAAFGFVTS